MGKMEIGEPQTLETPQTPDTPKTPRTHPLAGVKSFDDIALCMTQLITLSWPRLCYLFIRGQTERANSP